MISSEDLKDWVKVEDDEIPFLRRLERAAVETVQLGLGFYVGPEAEITEVIRFKGWPLSLSSDPIPDPITGDALVAFQHWDGSAFAAVESTSFYVIGSFVFGEGAYYPPRMSRFQVTYRAGYPPHETDPDVWFAPDDIQQMVKLLVGHWFENRESVVVGSTGTTVPQGVEMMMRQRARVAF